VKRENGNDYTKRIDRGGQERNKWEDLRNEVAQKRSETFSKGKEGTINIIKAIIDSLKPLAGGSFKVGETVFKSGKERD